MKEIHAVNCFLINDNKVLVLLRSDKVNSYQGMWAAIGGHIEESDTDLLERAITEIREETGIVDVELIAEGTALPIEDEKLETKWIIHPFVFKVKSQDVKLDWEHTQYRWIEPEEMQELNAVPYLYNTYCSAMQHDCEVKNE